MAREIKGKTIKTKIFYGRTTTTVRLIFDGKFYLVSVGDDVYYKGANEIFAMQKFNEI